MELDGDLARRISALQAGFLTASLDPERIEKMLSEAAELVRADAAMGAWIDAGAPLIVTWRAGPQIAEYYLKHAAGVDREGNLRSLDPDLDRINHTRRQLGTGVYHERAFATRKRIESAAYHREGFAPAGMNHIIGMTTRLAVGEAIFAFGYDTADAPPLADGRAKSILNLLLPAFAHGFETLDRKGRNLARLRRAIADSDLDATLDDEETGADSHARLQIPLPEPMPSYLTVAGPDSKTQATRLAQQFALTARQTQATRCMLEGMSTREIADELGISYNTARRHCEAVLQRTGAKRRSQLTALAFLER
ncbi:helix-turn-helix transcriptional regulator [Histidinibacterium aquaticum]|uniref:HTH luxR-type domain-containing protein n=1 Tax=Histidinibacterium aquaticum TaxID=2613962 RepID=A0A5J5GCA3_9RHOB|nr:LuxR family transcriptional regulator [Histidinibacterium aquaticum]KAA9005661.1 hypothetical protein F3S47_17305 [Histidinibacterium aquaticum]